MRVCLYDLMSSTGVCARVQVVCTIQLVFSFVLSSWSDHVNLVITCLRAEFEVYISQLWLQSM